MELAVAGVGTTPVTRDHTAPLPDTVARTCRAALGDAGIPPECVDGVFVTPPRMAAESWMMYSAHIGEYLGFETKCLMQVQNGGATALLAMRAAMDAVALGRCEVALVISSDGRPIMDLQHLQSFVRRAVFRTTGLYGPINGLFGFGAPVPIYAMSHQRYLHEHGLTEADVAEISVRLRAHASEHPLAQFRKPITVEDVLASPYVSPPIRLLQAAGISTGVAVAVITRADTARSTGRPVVVVKGYGEHHHPSHFAPRRGVLTSFPAVRAAAAQALDEAGVRASDIDVAEIYGVFGATECIVYEDVGFCEPGGAVPFVREGRSTVGGQVVINPTGGRISFGHPAGATPLYEVAEIVRQLRGEAPGIQVDAQLGLVQAEHGMNNGVVVMVMERAA